MNISKQCTDEKKKLNLLSFWDQWKQQKHGGFGVLDIVEDVQKWREFNCSAKKKKKREFNCKKKLRIDNWQIEKKINK